MTLHLEPLSAHHNDSFEFLMSQSFLICLTSADHPSLSDDLHYSEISIWEMTKNCTPPPPAPRPIDRGKVRHMVPFHAWQESFREAHHCYCQIGPAVYSSITPSLLTVTGHHALYINSGCDIDLFPQFFGTEKHPVSTCFPKKKVPSSIFLMTLFKMLQTLHSFIFLLSHVGGAVFQPRGEMLLAAREHLCILKSSVEPRTFCWGMPINNGWQTAAPRSAHLTSQQRETRQKQTTPHDTRAQSNLVQRDQNKAFHFRGGGGVWFQFSSHPHQHRHAPWKEIDGNGFNHNWAQGLSPLWSLDVV